MDPKTSKSPAVRQLPLLNELIDGLQHAFQHHLEVEPRGPGTLLLRVAGREFGLGGVSEQPDVLMRALCHDLAEVAAFGLATTMAEESAAGTRLRMDLITALAALETTASSAERPKSADGDEFLTTAQAAGQLGMSRPYVSMLCNQGKLGEVSRSEGGHRRIRQSAVDAYRRAHLDVQPPSQTTHEE